MGKASPLSDARSLVGITLSGGYKTDRLIDESGRGIVLAARDPSGHPVAVKVLRPEAATEEMLSRVSREASILSKLNDRHVVPVLDVGQDLESDLVYLVMPLLQGIDLAELLERVGMLSPRTAARIALQASSALVAAHAAGVGFRDVRSTKVFLENAAGGEIVVRVFGPGLREPDSDGLEVSRTASTHGRSGPTSRTSGATREGRRADVYGLGAVLYEMLCGKVPRPSESPASDRSGRPTSSRRIAPIQERAPWVDAPLALALQPALTSDTQRRYPSAESFSEMLRAVTAGDETVTADMLTPPDATARACVAERADHDADPLVGHMLGGRYKVLRLIGRGGMGGVYEVLGIDGRRVAAKVIFRSVAGQDDQHMRRFIREARAATAIDSPYVVKTFELGTDLKLGSPFIVMELLSGIDVAHLLQDRGPLDPPAIVRVFVQAALGLAAAHKVGIVHRDVKPANLFLHVPGDDRKIVVKVCDFGVAKREGDGATHDLTRAGGVLGSPLYMSPEQAKTAKHVDHRSDVWGLCVSLYQALSGSAPWDPDASLAELLLSICTDRVPPLADAAPWIAPELAAIVQKGLAREPEDRWQSMEALAQALRPHGGGTEEVTLDDLLPVAAHDLERAPGIEAVRENRGRSRSGRTLRSALSRAETLDPDTLLSARPPPPARGRAGFIVGGIVAVAAVAGILALRPPSGPGPSGAPSYPVRAAVQQATIRVPEGASVRVDGEARAVEAGAIRLSGEAGDAFEVIVRVGTAERATRVILAKNGRAEPDRIEAPAEATAPGASATSSAGSIAAAATAAVVAAGTTKPPVSKAAPSAGASSTSSKTEGAPTSPAPPSTVKPRESW